MDQIDPTVINHHQTTLNDIMDGERNFSEDTLLQISETQLMNTTTSNDESLLESAPHHCESSNFQKTTNEMKSSSIEQITLTNPITLLVKFVESSSGKELYCTFMKVEKNTDSIEKLQELLLERWSAKVVSSSHDNCYPPNLEKKESIRKVQLKASDRFNHMVTIDLDDQFLKDYSLQDSDMILVHL